MVQELMVNNNPDTEPLWPNGSGAISPEKPEKTEKAEKPDNSKKSSKASK